MIDITSDSRFQGIVPFEKKVWLASPTMHGDEQHWVDDAIQTNWVSTVGANINEVERITCEKIGCGYSVALSAGTAALHLAIKLAGERLYGQPAPNRGTLEGHKVFCSDMTFDATVNPVAYEGGELVFIDTEHDTWNMDPIALEKAFEIYPEVKLVVIAHLYGTPGKIDVVACERHFIVEIELFFRCYFLKFFHDSRVHMMSFLKQIRLQCYQKKPVFRSYYTLKNCKIKSAG